MEDKVGTPIKPALLSLFIHDFKNNTLTINEEFFSMNAPIKAREKFFVTVNVTNGDSATGFFHVILKVIKYIFKSNCSNAPYSICGTEFSYTTISGNLSNMLYFFSRVHSKYVKLPRFFAQNF